MQGRETDPLPCLTFIDNVYESHQKEQMAPGPQARILRRCSSGCSTERGRLSQPLFPLACYEEAISWI